MVFWHFDEDGYNSFIFTYISVVSAGGLQVAGDNESSDNYQVF